MHKSLGQLTTGPINIPSMPLGPTALIFLPLSAKVQSLCFVPRCANYKPAGTAGPLQRLFRR